MSASLPHRLLPPRAPLPRPATARSLLCLFFPRPVRFLRGSLSRLPGSCHHSPFGNRTHIPIWQFLLLNDPHRRLSLHQLTYFPDPLDPDAFSSARRSTLGSSPRARRLPSPCSRGRLVIITSTSNSTLIPEHLIATSCRSTTSSAFRIACL